MNNTFPPSVDLKVISNPHPEVAENATYNENLTLLYKGGKMLKDNATRFLVRHSEELSSAYISRVGKLNYDNILATITSWYSSKLFENDLEFDFKATGASNLPASTDGYYSNFIEDCDPMDSSLQQFFEKVAVEVLVYGRSFYLIDLPKLEVAPTLTLRTRVFGWSQSVSGPHRSKECTELATGQIWELRMGDHQVGIGRATILERRSECRNVHLLRAMASTRSFQERVAFM